MILADRSDYFGQGKGKIDHKDKIIPVDELMPIIEDIKAISFYNIMKDNISGNYNASAFEPDDALDCRDPFLQQAYEHNLLSDSTIKEIYEFDEFVSLTRFPRNHKNLKSGLNHILLLPIKQQNEMSFIGTTDINNGFQPGEEEHRRTIISFPCKKFRRNDRYYILSYFCTF